MNNVFVYFRTHEISIITTPQVCNTKSSQNARMRGVYLILNYFVGQKVTSALLQPY